MKNPRLRMSHATVKLLKAAAEIFGSEEALARHLGIGMALLRVYLEERRPLPDVMLLRAVDIVLENVKPATPVPLQPSPAQLPTSSG